MIDPETPTPAAPGASPSSREEVRLGSTVLCGETEVGTVEQVALEPATQRVTHLVVRRSVLPRRDVLVPVEAIARATDETTALALSADDFLRLPPYEPARYVGAEPGASATGRHPRRGVLFPLPFGRMGLARLRAADRGQTGPRPGTAEGAAGATISRGTRVVGAGGELGRVGDVLLDPSTYRATHFVVREGRLLGRDVVVPVDWASELGPDRVVVNADRAQLERLPRYRPDHAIAADIRQALYDYPPIRALDFPCMQVEVRDGVAALTGHVAHLQHREIAEQLARSVDGVTDVRNELIVDEQLPAQIMRAIAEEPRCQGAGFRISVDVRCGVAALAGTVPSEAARAGTVDAARRVAGVSVVADRLVIDPGAGA